MVEEKNVHIEYLRCGHTMWIDSPGIVDPAGILAEQPKCPTDGKIYVSDFDYCFECKRKNEKETT